MIHLFILLSHQFKNTGVTQGMPKPLGSKISEEHFGEMIRKTAG